MRTLWDIPKLTPFFLSFIVYPHAFIFSNFLPGQG